MQWTKKRSWSVVSMTLVFVFSISQFVLFVSYRNNYCVSLTCIIKVPTLFKRTENNHHRQWLCTNAIPPTPHWGHEKGRLGHPRQRLPEQAQLLEHAKKGGGGSQPIPSRGSQSPMKKQSPFSQIRRKQITRADIIFKETAPSMWMALRSINTATMRINWAYGPGAERN